MKSFYLLIAIVLVLASCNDKITAYSSISYGTSFGHCMGYCITETEIMESRITVRKIKRGNDGDTLSTSSGISDQQVEDIVNGIRADRFRELPETIGCPDCADGGAEWLELAQEGNTKRVTFEYGENIEGIVEAVKALRELTEELAPKTD